MQKNRKFLLVLAKKWKSRKFLLIWAKTWQRELKSLESISNHYKKYIITLDYDTNNYNGIKQISAIDFLLGRVQYIIYGFFPNLSFEKFSKIC